MVTPTSATDCCHRRLATCSCTRIACGILGFCDAANSISTMHERWVYFMQRKNHAVNLSYLHLHNRLHEFATDGLRGHRDVIKPTCCNNYGRYCGQHNRAYVHTSNIGHNTVSARYIKGPCCRLQYFYWIEKWDMEKSHRSSLQGVLLHGIIFITISFVLFFCVINAVAKRGLSLWELFLALFDLATLLTSCSSLGSCCGCGCGCRGDGFEVFQYPLSCGQFQSSTFFNIGYFAYQVINKQTIPAWSNSHSTVNQVQLQSNRFCVRGRPVT